jgi:Family of unknown function (DUF6153)
MTSRPRLDGPFGTPRWATIGLLATLLLGVLAMHGLASHLVPGVGHGEMGAVIGTSETASAVGTSHEDICEASVCPTERLAAASGGGQSTGTGLLTLCIAVLVGVAALLIVALVAARHSVLHQWVRTHQPMMPVRCGGPDPPNLHELSLLRC